MSKKAWIISVNMGYGHQRTAYPLGFLAHDDKVINANDYDGIPIRDRRFWKATQTAYEAISLFKRVPLLGDFSFYIFDRFQKIFSFYPRRNLSRPTFFLKMSYKQIQKGWGKDLIIRLNKNPLPFVSTFFTPAFMAEYSNYPGDIFCVICDADIARTWASLNPAKSRIKYFAPTRRAVERLKMYGVKSNNIFLTGYPLPDELIGGESMESAKHNLKNRILNLDPKKIYIEKYGELIQSKVGKLPKKTNHPLTIMFSVGGAGAQKEIAVAALKSLRSRIESGAVKFILSAGTKSAIRDYFNWRLIRLGMEENENIEILFSPDIDDYFRLFNEALGKTDILWTKPSELSFYSALGIPIIIAPPIGSQEDFNMRWLLKSGFGIMQENPSYTAQWLYDWLNYGYLAEAAMQGFIEGEKMGSYNIKKIIEGS